MFKYDAGARRVKLSISTILAQIHEIILLDIIERKVKMVNNRIFTIKGKK